MKQACTDKKDHLKAWNFVNEQNVSSVKGEAVKRREKEKFNYLGQLGVINNFHVPPSPAV